MLLMAGTVSATPVESMTTSKVYTENGYVLTRELTNRPTLLDNVSTTYIEEVQTMDEINALLHDEQGAITTVIVDEAIVREAPTQESNILNFIKKDIPIFVNERIDNYYAVEIAGIQGYIYREQLDESTLADVPHTISEENTPVEEEKYLGEEIVAYAKQFVGNPYVYGGTSLTNGADCSGFAQQIMKHFDIKLERTSRSQYATNGYKVSKSDLLPGDLVFYGYNGQVTHVAIYAGNGEIVHASTPKTGICMSKLEYGNPIIGMKRVITE